MSNLAKILTLNFVSSAPETATELHKQIQSEIEPDATLEVVQTQLTELAAENFILSAARADGTEIYWR